MSMTKKDYVIVAKVLREVCDQEALAMDDERDQFALVRSMTVALVGTNPQFDTQRFMAACLPDNHPWQENHGWRPDYDL